jgi:predicted Rossmann fold nucleotide-binding protein DprA/Smf involved in DNA uptake
MTQVHDTLFMDGLEESLSDAHAVNLLALSRIKGLGDEGVAQVLVKIRSNEDELSDFFRAPFARLVNEYGLRKEAARLVTTKGDLIRDEGVQLLERVRQLGIVLVAPGDLRYPHQVHELYGGTPPLLYFRGNLALLGTHSFAVINSSRPTSDGLDHTFALARRLAEAGGTLLSGTEGPAYNLVGTAAQQADANVVVVLHQGLFEVLDPLERNPFPLARRLDSRVNWKKILLVSPIRLDGRWQKGNGARRDTLLVALANTLVAVQIRSGGKMESLCQKARSLGRSVFVCQYSKPDKDDWGNTALIEEGALPLVGDAAGTNIDLVLKTEPPVSGVVPAVDDLERRRSLGQFFTPPAVAAFMWDMVEILRGRKLSRTARIIDPACGEGIFLRVAIERGHPAARILGVDIDETLLPVWDNDPLLKQAPLFRTNGLIDNLSISLVPGSFDLVIGNPPFGGKGLKGLLRLMEQPSGASRLRSADMFASEEAAKDSCGAPLPRHERAILDYTARQLSRYVCWRFREEPEENGELQSGKEPARDGLFADFHQETGRSLQATDYNRMAELVTGWPANQLLDLKGSEMRQTIDRLASTALEVFFTERFVQLAKPGGMIAVILPESILASDQLARLRAWFMEHAQLLAVVSLPQKAFTGVGANAKTAILFARRLTVAEQRATERSEPLVPGVRVLPRLRKAKVIMASPDLESPEWTDLENYLRLIIGATKNPDEKIPEGRERAN